MKMTFIKRLLLVLLFCCGYVHAQQRLISGSVTDEKGQPLPGVNVLVQGTRQGVATDLNGRYSIQAAVGQKLKFSFIGYRSLVKPVGEASTLNVRLRYADNHLHEVVAVAYGKLKKSDIVGSVASIDAEALQKQQTTDVTTAIQGNVPGVTLIQSGGQPGENPTIRIRGVASINASAAPLIIVDNVPYNGNINSISSAEIQSVNVLKDASATALYGSRGANGVILITTKQGELDSKPKVSLRLVQGVSRPAVAFHKVLGAKQYMEYFWEAMRNNYLSAVGGKPGQATAAQRFEAALLATNNLIPTLRYNPYGTLVNPVRMDGKVVPGAKLLWDTDWRSALINDQALRNEYQLNISGGGKRSTYALAGTYLKQQGSVKKSDFERFTTRLNLTSQVKDWLKVGLNTSLAGSNQNYPMQSSTHFINAMFWVYAVSSIYPIYKRDPEGQFVYDGKGDKVFDYDSNPFGTSVSAIGSLYNDQTLNKGIDTDINGFAAMELLKNLNFKTQVSYEQYLYDHKAYSSSEYGNAASVGGRVDQERDITRTLDFINAINYKNSFGHHNLEGQALMEAYDLTYDYMSALATGFLPNVRVLSGSTKPEGVAGYVSRERLVSYLGKASYNYDSKYFFEASFRIDGSSRFAPATRWGNFYALGGSWVLSKEGFVKKIDFVDFLKLKASYGVLGNNQTPSYFPYIQAFETSYNSQLNHRGVLLGTMVDSTLKWEKTASFNTGIEFGLFKDRLQGSLEYYNKRSIDLIYEKPLPYSTGNNYITTNVGAIRNYGYEFSLSSVNLRDKDFEWHTGLNFSMDRNKIVALTQKQVINGKKKWQVGRSLYDFFIPEYAGVDPEDGYAMWYKDVLDANGKPTGARETTKDYDQATRYYQNKRSIPDIQGGFSTNLRYKNFDLYALLNFSWGAYVYDDAYANLMSSLSSPGTQGSPDLSRRWQKKGDVTDVPLLLNAQNVFNKSSSRFLFKNNYARLKAVSLGYNFSREFMKDIGLSDLRLYLQGDNLWTWQSHKGIDPEQSLAGTTNFRSYLLRTLSLGLDVKF